MKTLTTRELPAKQMAPGLRIVVMNPATLGTAMDPFLQCDAFSMASPFFPPHPHAGFSAVTYLLPRSRGGLMNRDSLGDASEIRPGALHWSEAAAGMVHEEVPSEPGVVAEGLQIFVDLPSRHKLGAPAVYHVDPENVPMVWGPGYRARVLVGTLFGVSAPFNPRTACGLWDILVEPHATVSLPIPSDWVVFGLLLEGGPQGLPATADPVGLRSVGAGMALRIEGSPHGWHAVLLAGLPLNEPRALGGPFVMSDQAQLDDAKRRFGRGDMGTLARSF